MKPDEHTDPESGTQHPESATAAALPPEIVEAIKIAERRERRVAAENAWDRVAVYEEFRRAYPKYFLEA